MIHRARAQSNLRALVKRGMFSLLEGFLGDQPLNTSSVVRIPFWDCLNVLEADDLIAQEYSQNRVAFISAVFIDDDSTRPQRFPEIFCVVFGQVTDIGNDDNVPVI